MSHLSQLAVCRGNTKQHRARSRGFFFTFNNYAVTDIDTLQNWCKLYNYDFLFQEEKGEIKNTMHLQGFIYCKKQCIDFNWLKKEWPTIHWEKLKDKRNAIKYCCKLSTRSGDVFTNMEIDIPKDPMNGLKFHDWQKELIEIIENKPDSRSIYWIYDTVGNSGKTTFCKHLCLTKKKCLYVSGKCENIKYAIASFEESNGYYPNLILFDFVRSNEEKLSYEAIEAVKNGIFFVGKYESKQVVFDNPHVIIFANFKPELHKLSLDRWHIRNINDINMKFINELVSEC